MENFVEQVREHSFYLVGNVDSWKDFKHRNVMI